MELTLEKRPEAAVPPDLDPFLRPGESGHFAGEWLAYPYDGGQRFESAYAGMLIGRWNGWAVWSCTRDVAAAVVTDQGVRPPALAGRVRGGRHDRAEAERRSTATCRRCGGTGT